MQCIGYSKSLFTLVPLFFILSNLTHSLPSFLPSSLFFLLLSSFLPSSLSSSFHFSNSFSFSLTPSPPPLSPSLPPHPSDRSPIDGLSRLAFVVSRNGCEDDRLPSAHTCFNHLLLPAYSSPAIMRAKLKYAMTQSEGFGLR